MRRRRFPRSARLRTLVYLDFKAASGQPHRVTLRNFGYGEGEEWAKTKVYFEQRLARR